MRNERYSPKRIRRSVVRRFKELVGGSISHFENEVYIESRRSQLAALFARVSPRSFEGKSVLEVGCGHGHLGAELEKLGAIVVSLDGRRGNIRQLHKKFPNRDAHVCDACSPDLEQYGPVDIVFAFGLLYHLPKPVEFLRACSKLADTLLLETVVTDVTEPEIVWMKDGGFYDQSIHRRGCRPSPSWVEEQLRSNGYRYIVDLCLPHKNTEGVKAPPYYWPITGSGFGRRFGDPGFRRIWAAAKTEKQLVDGSILL